MMREDWVEVEFADVLQIVSGKNQKLVISHNGAYPIYGSGGIMGRANEYRCEKGTTVIGRKGTINSPIYVEQKFWNVDTAFGLSPYSVLENKLLYFFTVLFNFKKLDKSTTIPSLAKRDLLKILIPLPPLPIQRAIVAKIEALFTDLDRGIADLKKAQAQLKVYRQAVLKKAFEGELTSGIAKPKFISLGTVIEKPRYGTSKKCTLEPTGIAVLRIPNIGDGAVDSSELKYAHFQEKEILTLALQEGDLLTIRSNGSVDLVGKCALITKNDLEYLYAGYLIRLRPNHEKLNSKFLLYSFKSQALRNQIESKAKSTSGVNNINSGELASLEIPFFELDDQLQIVREIESRLSVCDKVEESITESLEKAKALRQSILKKAFEGRLLSEEEIATCKQAPDYEPAAVLLERIKEEKKKKG